MPTSTREQQLALLSLRVSWVSTTGGPHSMPAGSGIFSLPFSLWPHVLGPSPQLGDGDILKAVPLEYEAIGALAFSSASWELSAILPESLPHDDLTIILKPRAALSPVFKPDVIRAGDETKATSEGSQAELSESRSTPSSTTDSFSVTLRFNVEDPDPSPGESGLEPTVLELKLWTQCTQVSPFSLAACWKAQHGLTLGSSRYETADVNFESRFSEEGEPREDDIDGELQKYEIPVPDSGRKTPVYQADAAEDPRSITDLRPIRSGSAGSSMGGSPPQNVPDIPPALAFNAALDAAGDPDAAAPKGSPAQRSTPRHARDSPASSTGMGSQKSPGMSQTLSIKDLVLLGEESAEQLTLAPSRSGDQTGMPRIPDITSPPGRVFEEMAAFVASPPSVVKHMPPAAIGIPKRTPLGALCPDDELSVRDGVFGKSQATEQLLALHAGNQIQTAVVETPVVLHEGITAEAEEDDFSRPISSHDSLPAAEGAVAAAAVAERLLSKERRRLAIVMVGLPARGKTFTATKLTRYLRWLGHDTKLFNVGKYRRVKLGPGQTSDFFAADNKEGVDARNSVAAEAFEDMLHWMDQGGQVGVFDATNSTKERRQMLQRLAEGRCKLIFLECLCNDESIIERNAREKIRSSPDYATRSEQEFGPPEEGKHYISRENPKQALEDFLQRLRNYEAAYEPVMEGSYIKLINMVSGHSGQMQINNISGYLPGRIVFFLLNTHITPRPVLLTRHGESQYNVAGRIGGDAALSDKGEAYALKLAEFVNKRLKHEKMASVWSSTLQRTILTSRHIAPFPKVQWRALDEIQSGICDGMTYQEIKEQMPDEYKARKMDKLRYRYPRGESYLDVIQRLEPVIVELERQRHPVVVIAHQAVLRALYAYFMDKPLKEVPHIEMPLHTVIELSTGVCGINEKRYKLMDAPSSP